MRAFIAIDVSDKSLLYEKAKSYWHALDKNDISHKPVKKDNFHVTLLFLGEISHEYVNKVCEIIREIDFKPFSFTVTGFNSFGKRVVFFDIKEQEIFKEKHLTILSKLGLKYDKFHAHITISRIKTFKTLPHVKLEPIRIQARDLCLYESTLTSHGPIYRKFCCSCEL